ncbi:MAG: ATP-grasp domain-containing protein [Bacteroidales bacterium]|nr:ATP-grasp domain-containing protein [Bacteroidales bacterium]
MIKKTEMRQDGKNVFVHNADVLVFGTMGSIGPEICRSLSSHGLDVASVPFLQNIFNDEPGYRRTLSNAIVSCRPKVVIPVGCQIAISRFNKLLRQGAESKEILNRRKPDLQLEEALQYVRLITETEEKVRMLDSKVQSYELAENLGIRQPLRYDSTDGIPANIRVVFKRDISFGGHGVHIPRNPDALKNLIAHQSPDEPYIIEKFIEGQDYSLDVIRFRDNFHSGGYRCIRPTGNGPAEKREVLEEGDKVLEQMRFDAKLILDSIDYQGVCGFDFRTDDSGAVYLIECNPRFTGGIASQIEAGFDIPWILYCGLQTQ